MNNAHKIAAYLLDIQAVKLNIEQPFTWSSGWKSPVYCDNRMVLSFPEIRSQIKMAFCELIREKFPNATAIAGVATAGIAHGALIADEMGLPYIYVRTSAKSHGLKNLIEGRAESDKEYVVVEDLISTGGSSLKVIDTLQEAGLKVAGTVAIFTYGFPHAEAAFAEKNSPFYTLSNLSCLLEEAIKRNYIKAEELEIIEKWSKTPDKLMELLGKS